MPEIGIEKLDRSIYALAYPDRSAFNESMIDTLDMENIMPIIMAHELAHVAAYRVSGIMEHDALWAAFDKVADGNGKITYPVPGGISLQISMRAGCCFLFLPHSFLRYILPGAAALPVLCREASLEPVRFF